MQPATGLAFFISRKGGLTLADDKKNIGPEVEKTDAPPAPDQPAHGKAEPPTRDKMFQSKAAPENAAPNPQEAPAPAAPEQPAAPRDAT